MPPVGRVDITAADVVGTPPITSIELSDNGGDPTADDLHNIAAMALANDAIREEQLETFAQQGTDGADDTPTFTTSSTTYQEIASGTFDSGVSPTTDCEVGDIVQITFTCTAEAAANDGFISLYVKEPSMGAGGDPLTAARVKILSGTTVPVCLVATWLVAEAGPLLYYAKGKVTAGGTLTVIESQRLEALRFRTA
jgi:hypothetical protein